MDVDLHGVPAETKAKRQDWRATRILTGVLLGIWLLAGVGGGILFAGPLNAITLGGFPLGFWMAQQGSIIIFVLLILTYALAMGALDRRYRRARSHPHTP